MGPCAQCGAPLAPDALWCSACAAAQNRPTCPSHPGVAATGPCSRCGSFSCTACLLDEGRPAPCLLCRVREAAEVHEVAIARWSRRVGLVQLVEGALVLLVALAAAFYGNGVFNASLAILAATLTGSGYVLAFRGRVAWGWVGVAVQSLFGLPLLFFAPFCGLPTMIPAGVALYGMVRIVQRRRRVATVERARRAQGMKA